MKVLVINCGSSSLKYQVIDMDNKEMICKGTYERIGEESFLTHKINGEKYVLEHPVKNHQEALDFSIKQLLNEEYPSIKSLDEIGAIGHRTPHGGEKFKGAVLIDDAVLADIQSFESLAPLHIPACIHGIKACKELMPGKPNVAVFDTAFHQSITAEKYIYSLPYDLYEKFGVRKYGFHGTSHKYVAKRISELLGRDDLKIINCHLGQGASLCAIDGNKSVETSMGMTPVAGIPMCARSGDLDPSIVTFIMKKEGLKPEEMDMILNKESGLYALSAVGNDCRDIQAAADEGNERAIMALKHYHYKIAQYIAEYIVALGGVDVITFTAGVGENQIAIRKGILENLKFFGVKVDDERNQIRDEGRISADDSSVDVWVVPTNEELEIAEETLEVLGE